MIGDRPKIKPALTSADKALEYIGWVILSATWIYTLIQFTSLPETIPIHFNGAGEPDNFGNKESILALPAISTAIFIGFTHLNRFPHIFNYTEKITAENARFHYTQATKLMRYLKLAIVFIFSYMIYQTIQTAKGEADGLGGWFLPFVLVLLLAPLGLYLIKMVVGGEREKT